MAYLLGVVLFALAIVISVGLHETGHMATAKMFGMKVTRYFIGFGPTLFSFRRGETEYGLKAIPAGAFVKIVGMTPQDDDVPPGEEHRAMWRYPVWKRTIVLAAGSITHFLLAIFIIYGIILVTGKQNPAYADPNAAAYVDIQECVVPENESRACLPTDPVAPGKLAGLQDGDKIVKLGGAAVPTYDSLFEAIRASRPGPVTVEYERAGELRSAEVTLASVLRNKDPENPDSEVVSVAALGVAKGLPPGETMAVPVGAIEAVGLTGSAMGNAVVAVGEAVKKFPEKIPKLWTAITGGERDQDTPISVVGASRLGGETFERGEIAWWFQLLAMLNLFVGIFNLLPLLPLDGGHIAIAWFEKLRTWIYAALRKPDPGRVDYLKLMPVTYFVILVFGGITLLTFAADIVNPIRLP
jgi:membrane-associated protease RseP (regulator of RpoE activity)